MQIKIIKRQEITDDVAGEVRYCVEITKGKYFGGSVISTILTLPEAVALRDALTEKLK